MPRYSKKEFKLAAELHAAWLETGACDPADRPKHRITVAMLDQAASTEEAIQQVKAAANRKAIGMSAEEKLAEVRALLGDNP